MAYRETDTVQAEAEANDAIESAIEETMALRRLQEKRNVRRAQVGRWIGRSFLAMGLCFFGIALAFKSHGFGIAGVAMLILSGAVGLMRLGGGLSVQRDSEQASRNRLGM